MEHVAYLGTNTKCVKHSNNKSKHDQLNHNTNLSKIIKALNNHIKNEN